ncbi:MAG: hypothetical protein Q9222_002117 [Ikaeria aurantiellina]
MPSRASKHFFHKNRSQASLLTSQDVNGARASYHPSPIDSPLHSPAFPPSAAAVLHDDSEGQQFGHPYSAVEPRPYQPAFPTRSHSQRSPPTHYSPADHYQPKINLVNPAAGQQNNLASSAIDENPDAYYHQAPAPKSQKEETKRRRFFGLGSSTKESQTSVPTSAATPQRLGRSISVRTKPSPYQNTSNSTSRPGQQRWPSESSGSTYPPNTSEDGEEGDSGTPSSGIAPPIPDKDPLRSVDYPSSAFRDGAFRKPSLQGVVTDANGRPRFERQGSATSATWESPQSVHYNQQIQPDSHHLPPSYQPSPSSATSASSHPLSAREHQETLHQYHRDLQNSRPPSQQSYNPPSPLHTHPARFDYQHQKLGQAAVAVNSQGPRSMGPPQPQSARDRRSQELAQQQQNQQGAGNREGGYQPYHQANQNQGQPQGPPPAYSAQLGVNNQQGGNYRGAQPSPMAQQGSGEQGRNTPPPSRSRDDLSGLDVAQLVARHDELQDKYRKVKKYYFEKEGQVQQLQNTLAHQRLAQSRTSLDDNEYISRFSRLDGAINNLAFNIRREWRSVPPWLAPAVNRDATTNPTKEMTAVGRACISRWLVDELFDRFFHPSLEPGLSTQLKIIEKNLRRFAPPTPTDEEREGLMAKISNWRLATLEGLNELLSSASAAENRNTLTTTLVEKMIAALSMNLKDPAPAGLDGGVSMIVELAVGIACNLPLESRDVFVEYVYPNSHINETVMKLETGLPPLTNPGEGIVDDMSSRSSLDTKDHNNNGDDTDSLRDSEDVESPQQPSQQSQSQSQKQQPEAAAAAAAAAMAQKKKGGMFGGFMGGKKAGAVAGGSGVAAQQALKEQAQKEQKEREREKEEKVRFCAFMAVEVRGRSVLVKAPVWVHLV